MFLSWSILLMFLSLIFFISSLINFDSESLLVLEYFLISIQNLDLKFYFLLDWMSNFFSGIVLMISAMIIMYSKSYMAHDKNKNSFCLIVLLFVLSMILLIMMPNMIMLILGWDGLGLVSYCLVIYYQSVNSYNSGMMTIMSNRIGDVMIMLTLVFFTSFGSFDMTSVNKIELICGIMILIAACTKSAQVPFSAWLPAAMAAPTPVSSLVHSSTLVTAGIYLLMRFNFLFNIEMYSEILIKIALLTMIMSGINAFLETDFKKVIAFSTLSQLSMMMIILSLGVKEMAFFHLIMHAIFKSMLFMCAGLIIHSFNGIQDIRMLGNFFNSSPLISSCMFLSLLSLMGFPFIGGFYSKDLIVEFLFFSTNNFLLILMFLLGILFTFLYCSRMIYIMLLKSSMNLFLTKLGFDFFMIFPIFFLCFIMLISGSYILWLTSSSMIMFISSFSKNFMLFFMIFAVFVYFTYLKNPKNNFLLNLDFFFKIWHLSFLSSYIILVKSESFLKISLNDWTWMEILGPKSVKSNFFSFYNFNYWIEKMNFNKLLLMIMLLIFIILV
uniref:NADH-ubiquinone oxidoreductase chain 5 n=1 Tax=Amblyomma ovale TaxID=208206 RepID=A0A7D5K201_9ACAR|nr:NADH dehydrogenase subunit 5 [Amblyomma ovale]